MKILLDRLFKAPEDILRQGIVFLAIFASAKFAEYIYFDWNISSAILWTPPGITLAVIYLWGYRYAPVIFLAYFLTFLSSPYGYLWPWTIFMTLGQVFAGMVGAFLLRYHGYGGQNTNVMKLVYFLTTIVIVSMIVSATAVLMDYFMDAPSLPVTIPWGLYWAGHVLSCLLLFPLITSWSQFTVVKEYPLNKIFEWGLVTLVSVLSVPIVFWKKDQYEWLFFFFAVMFICLFWVCLRFTDRLVNSYIVVVAIFGIAGLFLLPNPDVALNVRLFIAELCFLLILPIFYMFSAMVQDSEETISDLALTKSLIEKEMVAKNEFIAVLAHELRNPLAPLKTTLEILELEAMSSDIKNHLRNASHQVHTMCRLLDDLLDVTRISQGKFELRITPVDLCTTLTHCLESTEEICRLRRHRIIMDTVCADAIWLDVDPVRFEQVVVNIINNAAKYTNVGGEIRIRHYVSGEQAILEIQDTGIGIIPENLASIFDSFWQVKKIVPLSNDGIGVGLSLTKLIVEMHGGTITASSEGLDKGSTFTISLPLSIKDHLVMPALVNDAVIKPLRILVTDDNASAATALSKLLRMKNHTVETVYTGSEAINAVTYFKPDCILLDIGLPDLNGYQVAQKLRQNGYKNRIIALSGYSQEEDMNRAFKNGFDEFMVKPVNLKQLEDYFRSDR